MRGKQIGAYTYMLCTGNIFIHSILIWDSCACTAITPPGTKLVRCLHVLLSILCQSANRKTFVTTSWGRDNVCVAVAGGKTPDISSERRTFADVMTENKLKATQVDSVVPTWCRLDCLLAVRELKDKHPTGQYSCTHTHTHRLHTMPEVSAHLCLRGLESAVGLHQVLRRGPHHFHNLPLTPDF